MPVYEYECENCGKRIEFFLMGREKEPEKCEDCGGSLRRLISGGVGFIFKGSGFYATDYKKNSNEKESGESSKSSCSSCSGGNCSTCK
ncbi:MAG: FmdB family zinc ribbon protein [candidate division WOR-3 bacterium]|uniref:FmdB family transcriptional regulator n=1 Tax=candidate division WOR-3 bacterium TaxID=2052148 RepID=A0A7V4E1U7_UNCW3